MAAIQRLFSHLLAQVAIRSLRSSALTTGAVLLLSSLGAWQYLGNSLQAVDVRIASTAKVRVPPEKRVLIVAIDDGGYQKFFGGASPLRQDRLAEFLQVVAGNSPHAKKIVVDLDLAPTLRASETVALDAVLSERPDRWVLASITGATPADNAARASWRQKLCLRGTAFGLPHIPTVFGYINLSHQFSASLAEAAMATGSRSCIAPVLPLQLQSAPVSPHSLREGAVLAFGGDLSQLAQSLKALDPQWVIVGGTWGSDDSFLSPFGTRFGVEVHAAELAGRLTGLVEVRYWLQLCVAWIFVTVMSLLLSTTSRRVRQWLSFPATDLPGHQFFETRLFPLLLMSGVLFLAAVLNFLLGLIYGYAGVWIPSRTVGSVTLISVMLVWNWGKANFPDYRTLKEASTSALFTPFVADWASLKLAVRSLRGGGGYGAIAGFGKARLAFEASMALLSILMQNVLPVVSVFYAMSKPL